MGSGDLLLFLDENGRYSRVYQEELKYKILNIHNVELLHRVK